MCHCLACQKRTGSVFGVQARFHEGEVRVEGRATEWSRTGDEGHAITFSFCPTCGATVFYRADFMRGAIAVAVGAFADPGFPPPRVEVYDHRRHPWAVMPELHAKREA
jgi:hypothetical protein